MCFYAGLQSVMRGSSFCTIKGRAARRWLVCLPLAQNLRTVLLHAQYCLLPHCYEVLPFTRHITSHG